MAVKIGSLFFDMRVGLAAWQRDMGKASKRMQRFGRSVGRVAKQMSIFGGAVSGVGLVLLANRSIEAADNVDKLSTRLGISTEALSQYQHVAKLTGVQFNTLTMAFQRMTRRVSEAASGTGEARDAIAELGLSAQSLERLAPDQQFEVLADALMDVENQTDRVRLAFKLFDSEGVAVLQTMERGAEGIRRMRDEADRLGKTLTREQTDKLVAAKDAWTRFNASVEGMVQTLVVELGPALAAIGEWLADRLPVALSWLKVKWGDTWQGILLLLAHVTGAIGQMFVALAPLVSGDLHEKYKEWGQDLLDVTGNMVDMAMAAQDSMEVSIATLGRFDETLKDHAGSWKAVASATEEASAAAVVYPEAAEQIDAVTRAGDSLGESLKDVAHSGIRGQVTEWNDLRSVAVSALQDMISHVLQLNSAMGAGGGAGAGGFGSFLAGLFAGGGGGAGSEFAGLPMVPMARGGIVTEPTLAMIGEAGPEAVVPLDEPPGPRSLRQAAGTVNHFGPIDMTGASVEAVARLERLVGLVNGSIERRAVAAVRNNKVRGGHLAGS